MAGTLGSYGAFISSMLSLREQRLKEEQLKQAERMAQQEQMSKMMQGMGQQFGNMAETMGQNKLANQLGPEYFGSASDEGGIRGGSMGSAYSEPGVGGTGGWGGGGMAEFKLRMGMEETRSQADYRNAMIKRMGQNLELQQDRFRVQQAVIAKRDIDKNLDQDVKNENWFIKENDVIDSAIEKATTPEQWKNAVDRKTAVHRAAEKRGMKVDPFDPSKIAPFMSQDDRDALQTQQDAVSEARTALKEAETAPPGLIDRTRKFFGLGTDPGALGLPGIPTQKEGAVLSAQELLKQQQEKLRKTPGASFYGENPVKPKTEATEGRKTGALTEGIPVGTTKMFRNKATGKPEPFAWDGSEWIPQ